MDQIKEKDEKIIEHVRHIETVTKENEETKNMELTLSIEFSPENTHFTNQTLSVTLEFESEEEVKEIRGTKIDWKEGMDVTQKKIKKKQKHKKTGETRTVVKTVDADSFFNIFKDRKVSADGGDDSEDENNERDKMDEVQQTVEDFHDLLIPEALEYYLGLNEDFDMLGMGEDDDEDDDDDDDDSDDTGKKDKKI
jgi:nucleosome assembly protein 1-like 1